MTGRLRSNDVDLRGQRVILMGECSVFGNTKAADGKKIPAKQLLAYRLRLEDQRWLRTSGAIREDIIIEKKYFNTFFEEATDE